MGSKGRITLLMTAAVMVLMLMISPTCLASNPPPEGSHFQGPAVRGQFVFQGDSAGNLLAAFNGTCGAGDVFIEQISVPGLFFPEDVTEENLLENVIDYYLILPYFGDCEPNLKDKTPDGLLTIQVKNYIVTYKETGEIDTIVVDVIMLWVVPK